MSAVAIETLLSGIRTARRSLLKYGVDVSLLKVYVTDEVLRATGSPTKIDGIEVCSLGDVLPSDYGYLEQTRHQFRVPLVLQKYAI